jgi:hypothetical protein
MKKILFIASFIFAFSFLTHSTAQAQYHNALGVRVGDYTGISFKTFIEEQRAVDLILGFKSNSRYSGIRFTGLYQIHHPTDFQYGALSWFYGGGASVGGLDYKNIDRNEFLLSADGVIGLDYKFVDAPLNLSLDWKPALQFSPDVAFKAGQFGFSVRITF